MTATATPTRTHVFYSRHLGLRLVRKRCIQQPTALGTLQTLQAEVTASFDDDSPGDAGQLIVRPGEGLMTDEDGTERDLLTWLRQHPDFNGAFFEEGNEPGLLRPSDEEFTDAVIAATGSLDTEALYELLDAERQSHNRDHLIQRAERALEAVGEQTHGTGEAA